MQTVIFDLDGTLADTSGDLLAAANAAFGMLGHPARLDPVSAEDQATALRGGRAMLRLGFGRHGAIDETQVDAGYPVLLEAYAQTLSVHTTLYPGVMDAVERLRVAGHLVGICTNKPSGLAESLMQDLGVRDAFAALEGADTLPVRKPDPAPFRHAVELTGGDPALAVLIGDTETDRETARAAGVPSVLVTFGPLGRGVEALAPEALLDHYDDLDRVLSGIWTD